MTRTDARIGQTFEALPRQNDPGNEAVVSSEESPSH